METIGSLRGLMRTAFEFSNEKPGTLPHIGSINLGSLFIGDHGAENLAEAFKRATIPHLKRIDLHYNSIGPAGAKALSEALARTPFPELEFIHIAQNNIGPEGCKALADALGRGAFPALKSSRFTATASEMMESKLLPRP